MVRRGPRRGVAIAGLCALATALGLVLAAAPAFAWTSSVYTCIGNYTSSTYPSSCTSNPTLGGSIIYDTAQLTLSNSGSPYGSLTVLLAKGTCSSIGSTISGVSGSNPSVTTYGTTYYVASIATSSLTSGSSYVWLTSYSGTSGGYPYAPTSGAGTNPTTYSGNLVDCEPFIFQATTGVREFPSGMVLLLALALPALVLMRRRLVADAPVRLNEAS